MERKTLENFPILFKMKFKQKWSILGVNVKWPKTVNPSLTMSRSARIDWGTILDLFCAENSSRPTIQ